MRHHPSTASRRVFALCAPLDPVVRWAKKRHPRAEWGLMDKVNTLVPDPQARVHFWNVVNDLPEWESVRWMEQQSPAIISLSETLRFALNHNGGLNNRVLVLTPERAESLRERGFDVIRVEYPSEQFEGLSLAEAGVVLGVNYNDVVGLWRLTITSSVFAVATVWFLVTAAGVGNSSEALGALSDVLSALRVLGAASGVNLDAASA